MKKICALLLLVTSGVASAQEAPSDWLIIGPMGGVGPAPFGGDLVLARIFGADEPAWPKEGDSVGQAKWRAARFDQKGELQAGDVMPGCAYGRVESDRDRVVICSVGGTSSFFVNGEAFTGDVYGHGYVRVPLLLRKGTNHILARLAARDQSKPFFMKFEEPASPLLINPGDATLPDMMEGTLLDSWAAVPVLNASAETVRGATLRVGDKVTELPPIPPLGILKVPFEVAGGPELTVVVTGAGKTHEQKLTLRDRKKGQSFKRTFRSTIDDSIQYYSALLPKGFDPKRPYALVLALHGATVEAESIPDVFTAREWCMVVAPTNRRPFGFDWEDWGRIDTLEVLDQVQRNYLVDPSRIYLMGHSMGGHGTWQTTVQYPDRFAAIGPSAGWVSFWSYGGGGAPRSEVERLFQRATNPSQTLELVRNLEPVPVFILHGTKDQDVPVEQAQIMEKELRRFHRDFRVRYEKDQPHWWDYPETPGCDCMNLDEMFDFFQRHRRPDTVDRIDFRTFNPAVSSRCDWVEIVAQSEPLGLSRVTASRVDTKIAVTTQNVAHLRLRTTGTVTLDGTTFEAEKSPADFMRDGGKWKAGAPAGLRKTPELCGPFKQAFQRNFLLVYGTGGDKEETRACLAKARYDSQIWWYRGNGCGRVMADTDVTPELAGTHTLILYGDEESNALWKAMAEKLPVRVRKGSLTAGDDKIDGDVACAAIYPNPLVEDSVVGLVGATGPAGRRAWWGAATWFMSGTGMPDVAVWDASVFEKSFGGVRLAGYFGPDWKPDARLWFPRKARQDY